MKNSKIPRLYRPVDFTKDLNWHGTKRELQRMLSISLHATEAFRVGEVELRSGEIGHSYVNLRPLGSKKGITTSYGKISAQDLVNLVTDCYYGMMKNEIGLENFDLVIGIPNAATFYSGIFTSKFGIRTGLAVKEIKKHGEPRFVHADIEQGCRILLYDDALTKGGSVIDEVERVSAQAERENKKILVEDVLILVNRLSGGEEIVANYKSPVSPNGIKVSSFMTLKDVAEILSDERCISPYDYNMILSDVRL